MLALIILLPLAAAIGLAFVPGNFRFATRLTTLATTLLVALRGVALFWRFDTGEAGYQFVTTIPLLGTDALGIHCRLGLDGINVGLILMGAIVAFAAACVSWEIKDREKEYYILLLLMTGGILGAFASLDLFFFYFFHELALVPTFIMIGVWGRGEQKNYATFQITMYLSVGALIAYLGASRVRVGAQSDCHASCRRAQKVRFVWSHPYCPAHAAHCGAKLDAS